MSTKHNVGTTESGRIVRTSVRSMVEFLLRSGDLDTRTGAGVDREAMLAGGRIHRKLQKAAGSGYQSEVSLSEDRDCGGFAIRVEGRADGVFSESRKLALAHLSAEDPGGHWEQASFDASGLMPDAVNGAPEETGESANASLKLEEADGQAAPAEADGQTAPMEADGQTAPVEADGQPALAEADGQAAPVEANGQPAPADAEDPSRKPASNPAFPDALPVILPETADLEGLSDELPASITFIDEIKGVYMDVDRLEGPVPVHLAQAGCYAAIYLKKEGLPVVGVRMTYASLENEHTRAFYFLYTADRIRAWYQALTGQYERWARRQIEWEAVRNASMGGLSFPFPYREGQKNLVASVYRTITDRKELFLMAPTGVGKTMAVVYPSVRAVGAGLASRIFYLTAKNQTITVGWEALSILRSRGLRLKAVVITAKDKICPYAEPSCNPEDCRYARGHFDRVNDAVFAALREQDFFDRPVISDLAMKAEVCPFEFSLDLSSFADAILGDYNYAFDPSARLKRFFGEGVRGDYILLADEAHNLLDRAREMYSASLVKDEILTAKKVVKARSRKAERTLEKLNKEMLALRRQFEAARTAAAPSPEGTTAGPASERTAAREEDPLKAGHETLSLAQAGNVAEAAIRAAGELEALFKEERSAALREEVLDFYFDLRAFIARFEEADDDYIVYTSFDGDGHFQLTLRCVNPARQLQAVADKGRAAVFFSATLLPVAFYRSHFSTREDNYAIYARSPFRDDQKRILIGRDVSTRFRSRGPAMYRRIARYIHDTAASRSGNYMAFFPSYKFMADVLKVYREEFDEDGINWVAQSRYMGEMDREIFLENFYEDPGNTLVGFCVMGGVFAEGIDLTGSRLIGAIIVGCGLPQVSEDVELLREYYDARDGSGFAGAYLYPGMNKVLQSAGRVIRTARDKGVIVLLDDRFLTEDCQRLFPREWESWYVVREEETRALLKDFWNDENADIRAGAGEDLS